MKPVIWGPHVWYTMHYVALRYPQSPRPEDKETYYQFYRKLGAVLPCAECRAHFRQVWRQAPLTLDELHSRSTLFAWTVRVHNIVNKSLNKPEMPLVEAQRKYTTRKMPDADVNTVVDEEFHMETPYDSTIALFESLLMVGLLLALMLNIKKLPV